MLECLLEVAAAADLHIEIAGRNARNDPESPLASGVCRVRGQWWVILSSGEPVSAQIQMLAKALKTHAYDVVGGPPFAAGGTRPWSIPCPAGLKPWGEEDKAELKKTHRFSAWLDQGGGPSLHFRHRGAPQVAGSIHIPTRARDARSNEEVLSESLQ